MCVWWRCAVERCHKFTNQYEVSHFVGLDLDRPKTPVPLQFTGSVLLQLTAQSGRMLTVAG
jgi:hypothetical protein